MFITIAQHLFNFIIAAILCCLFHEGSHFLMAKLFGETIYFEFYIGYLFNVIPIPRGIWEMPIKFSSFEKKVVAAAGFSGEFLFFIPIYLLLSNFAMYYIITAIVHILAYSFYAGDASDFQWFKS